MIFWIDAGTIYESISHCICKLGGVEFISACSNSYIISCCSRFSRINANCSFLWDIVLYARIYRQTCKRNSFQTMLSICKSSIFIEPNCIACFNLPFSILYLLNELFDKLFSYRPVICVFLEPLICQLWRYSCVHFVYLLIIHIMYLLFEIEFF